MGIDFELYKIFYFVASNESISKGAEKLLISQPAVTQAIKNLEIQLNTTLFIRTKKGVVLTEEGKELYSYIKEGMNYFVNGTNKILQLKNLETGIIKIGASTSITENYLMKYINKFHKNFPSIEIKIINNLTDTLMQELRNGNVDIVICNESFKDNKDLIFKPIEDIEYTFVSNKKMDLNINQILEQIIIQSEPSIARGVFDSFIKENNLNYKINMEVVSHRLVTEFVKNGLGIGFVVKQYVIDDLKNGNLFELQIDLNLPKRKIGYVIKENTIPTSAVKELLEIIKNNN